jgi:hypothetical protein
MLIADKKNASHGLENVKVHARKRSSSEQAEKGGEENCNAFGDSGSFATVEK